VPAKPSRPVVPLRSGCIVDWRAAQRTDCCSKPREVKRGSYFSAIIRASCDGSVNAGVSGNSANSSGYTCVRGNVRS
jgi:hypothetical protein